MLLFGEITLWPDDHGFFVRFRGIQLHPCLRGQVASGINNCLNLISGQDRVCLVSEVSPLFFSLKYKLPEQVFEVHFDWETVVCMCSVPLCASSFGRIPSAIVQ